MSVVLVMAEGSGNTGDALMACSFLIRRGDRNLRSYPQVWFIVTIQRQSHAAANHNKKSLMWMKSVERQ
jgi:NAD(P)H-hydrate repair Nnr-like enzyme with NAD(P)H-hydrate epimerase domain